MVTVYLPDGRAFIVMAHLKIGWVNLPFQFKKVRWQNQWASALELDFNTPSIALGLAFEVMNPVKRPPEEEDTR